MRTSHSRPTRRQGATDRSGQTEIETLYSDGALLFGQKRPDSTFRVVGKLIARDPVAGEQEPLEAQATRCN